MDSEIDNEALSAFLDGELPPPEMERIAKILAERPDLDAWVRRQENLRATLRQSFSETMTAPPSQTLLATLHGTPPSRQWRMRQKWAAWKLQIWAPAGAALAAGLIAGFWMQPASDLVRHNGRILARGSLAEALDHKLASIGYVGGGTRIGISFRSRDGHDCRAFDQDRQAGLACHQADGWVIEILESHPAETGGAYRMAGSEMPDSVRQAVTARIQGAPFDAAAEKAAQAGGWK